MLDIERFQTVFKRCARGSVNVMKSIENNMCYLETALSNRVTQDQDWTRPAPGSSTAGFAATPHFMDKQDRLTSTLGVGVPATLTMDELEQVCYRTVGHVERTLAYLYNTLSYLLLQIQMLWAVEDKDFSKFLDAFIERNRTQRLGARIENITLWGAQGGRRQFSSDEVQYMKMERTIEVRYAYDLTHARTPNAHMTTTRTRSLNAFYTPETSSLQAEGKTGNSQQTTIHTYDTTYSTKMGTPNLVMPPSHAFLITPCTPGVRPS